MLGGCSSASKSSDEPEQTATPATEVTVGKFTCQSEISIQEGSSTAYEKYCKISTGEKFSVTPEKVDTKKAVSNTVALTLTDESGNITMTKVKVTVTPKPTPTPEPVEEPTPEPEQHRTTKLMMKEQRLVQLVHLKEAHLMIRGHAWRQAVQRIIHVHGILHLQSMF